MHIPYNTDSDTTDTKHNSGAIKMTKIKNDHIKK